LDEEVKSMENVYAAMLLHKAGKEINEETVTSVLKAAGITVDAIKAAPTMMAAAPAPAAAPAAEEKPKEEKKKKAEDEKAKEDAALEGLGALFG
jgi:large subunit ribosomal protein L12